MTAAEFRAWLDTNFPGHDQRGRHYGKESAAAFLGITPRSVQRKRDGKQPITARDELLISTLIREQNFCHQSRSYFKRRLKRLKITI